MEESKEVITIIRVYYNVNEEKGEELGMIKVKINNENKEIEWIKEPTEEQIKNYKETFGGNLKQEIMNIVKENLEERSKKERSLDT